MAGFLSRLARLAALEFGKSSEDMAARKMRKSGYRIIDRNFSCREGEIDVIAEQDGCLVFCEVKGRRNSNFGSALEGITPAKIRKIKKAAEVYIARNGLHEQDCRFDVVTIDESEGELKLEIIPNAF
ncbi:MAG: YraN family protein [Nitrospinota bacterium]|nr:YraN family protein [Nitrospinota bacterium]